MIKVQRQYTDLGNRMLLSSGSKGNDFVLYDKDEHREAD